METDIDRCEGRLVHTHEVIAIARLQGSFAVGSLGVCAQLWQSPRTCYPRAVHAGTTCCLCRKKPAAADGKQAASASVFASCTDWLERRVLLGGKG